MNKNIVIGVVVVAVVAVIGFQLGVAGPGEAAMEPVELTGVDGAEALVELAQGVTLGSPDAPITIVEFGDYQCPGCAGFNQAVKPQIELSLVQSGEAKFVFYDFPLINIHPWAFLAARAGRCAAGQGDFWDYHDRLFEYQQRWSTSPTAPIGDFVEYAGEVGLDEGAFESCLRSDQYADVVTANLNLAQQLGVSSTPTVMISVEGSPARQAVDNNFLGIQATIEALRAEQAAGAGGGEG